MLKQAIRAASRPVVAEARARVKYGLRIRKLLKVISVEAKPDGTVTAHVGVPNKGRGYLALWIEQGTGRVSRRRRAGAPARCRRNRSSARRCQPRRARWWVRSAVELRERIKPSI